MDSSGLEKTNIKMLTYDVVIVLPDPTTLQYNMIQDFEQYCIFYTILIQNKVFFLFKDLFSFTHMSQE